MLDNQQSTAEQQITDVMDDVEEENVFDDLFAVPVVEEQSIILDLDPEPTIDGSFVNNLPLHKITLRRLNLYFTQFGIIPRHCVGDRVGMQEMMLYFLIANRKHLLIECIARQKQGDDEVNEIKDCDGAIYGDKQEKTAEKVNSSVSYYWCLPAICVICGKLDHEPLTCQETFITFSYSTWEPEDMQELVDAFQQSPKAFNRVQFDSNKLDEKCLTELVRLVSGNRATIADLSMRFLNFPEATLLAIADGLVNNDRIEMLDISSNKNGYTSKVYSAFANAIYHNPRRLRQLDMESLPGQKTTCTISNLVEFRRALAKNIHFELLRFTHNYVIWTYPHIETLGFKRLIDDMKPEQQAIATDIVTTILDLLRQNHFFAQNSGEACLHLLKGLRIVMYTEGAVNNGVQKSEFLLPLELWLEVFEGYAERSGIGKAQLEKVMKFAKRKETLVDKVTMRRFLSYACGDGRELELEDWNVNNAVIYRG